MFNRVGLYEGDVRLVQVVRDVRSVAATAPDREGRRRRRPALGSGQPAVPRPAGRRPGRLRRGAAGGLRSRARTAAVAPLAPVLGIRAGRHYAAGPFRPGGPAAGPGHAARRSPRSPARGCSSSATSRRPARLRRAALLGWRKAKALRERRRRSVEHRKAEAWALSAPPPWVPEGEAERLSPADVQRLPVDRAGLHRPAALRERRLPTLRDDRPGALPPRRPGRAGRRPSARARSRPPRGCTGPTPRPWAGGSTTPRSSRPTSGARSATSVRSRAWPTARPTASCRPTTCRRSPDPDVLLAEFHRVLAPDGVLLVQVPILAGETTALPAADTAAPGTARWSFGVDVIERFAAAGLRRRAPGHRRVRRPGQGRAREVGQGDDERRGRPGGRARRGVRPPR